MGPIAAARERHRTRRVRDRDPRVLTIIVKATEMVVMPTMLAQYGSPITVLSATQGVNTVTARFSRLRMT